MACRLPQVLRQFYFNSRSVSTASRVFHNPSIVPVLLKLVNFDNLKYDSNLKFSPRTTNLGLSIPSTEISRKKIIDLPKLKVRQIKEPERIIYNKEDIIPDKSLELPTVEQIIEKEAVRLIVIRKHKIKLHKLKKKYKRHRYTYRKRKLRLRSKKEKLFQKHIFLLIKHAEKFSAEKYVQKKLHELTREILPNRWRREILPPEMIKQFLEEHQLKKEAKKNRKRLTLD